MITESTQRNNDEDRNRFLRPFTRRSLLGAGSSAAAALLTATVAGAQQRTTARTGARDRSATDPGPENRPLLAENPSSNAPPPTDQGDVGPIWYSFDLTHKRIQEGGWTHQVTQRELPSSKDLAGVNMRLTAGSFRELHWHTADEWAIMLAGNARVSVLNPDGTIFLDDVAKGDLWYFPAGYPHSIQGLGPDGCEFLLVFEEGMFSEDNTFLLSEWLAHTLEIQDRVQFLGKQDSVSELLPLADEEHLAVMPYNPLAGGLLTGKHRHDAKPSDGRFTATVGKAGAMYQQRYWHEREFATIETLREVAAQSGESLARLSRMRGCSTASSSSNRFTFLAKSDQQFGRGRPRIAGLGRDAARRGWELFNRRLRLVVPGPSGGRHRPAHRLRAAAAGAVE